ncbi:MAG: hypothetical protein ACTHN3_07310 [Solirubrobacterales bacterium]
MEERELHNDWQRPADDSLETPDFEESLLSEPEVRVGRVLFPPAWSTAVKEGLISPEEYITELLRHVQAEGVRAAQRAPKRAENAK